MQRRLLFTFNDVIHRGAAVTNVSRSVPLSAETFDRQLGREKLIKYRMDDVTRHVTSHVTTGMYRYTLDVSRVVEGC